MHGFMPPTSLHRKLATVHPKVIKDVVVDCV
jgi:hypothetical protein